MNKVKNARVRGGSLIKGTAELIIDFTDDVESESFIYKLQGNEFRLTPFRMAKAKFCDYLRKDKFILPSVFKDFNIPYECPLKAGNYTGQYTLDMNVPPNFDGTYRIQVNLFYANELRDSYNLTGEVHHYVYEV